MKLNNLLDDYWTNVPQLWKMRKDRLRTKKIKRNKRRGNGSKK